MSRSGMILRSLVAAGLFLASTAVVGSSLIGCDNPTSPSSGCSGICLEYCECVNGRGSRTCQTGSCWAGTDSSDCRSRLEFARRNGACRG